MKFSGETKFFIGVIVATVVLLVGAVVVLSKPQPEKVISNETLMPEGTWATGSATPKATLVEFADFQCPACGTAYPIVKQVVETYKSDLKYAFRHFPLEQHENARRAAEAAEAAGAQGKFWEMHDLLFKNQENLSQEAINGFALELKLDMDKFTKETAGGIYKAKVDKDLAQGQALGINSTPSFFLNGKKLNLFSFNELKNEVEKAIKGEQK
jgi:protein-disulfide isomerase